MIPADYAGDYSDGTSDSTGNGGRSHVHRGKYAATVQETSPSWKQKRHVSARARPKADDAKEPVDRRKPRIRLEDQDGTVPPPEDAAEAIKAADELFQQEDDSRTTTNEGV